ncbi:polysaccharide pyruvyl transferase family protein [Desulfovibrio sp. OttesenSCG-928-G15]|nr:polysaccharide pyruvyl transferase family protein [Desulfovibrio sp. OttesenSCG-928-G15]
MSGNIGGPAINIAVVEELQKRLPEIGVSVLSKYPATDASPTLSRGWNFFPFTTWTQLFLGLPLGIVTFALRKLGLPTKWAYRGSFRPYAAGTILVDTSGISFTDDRPFVNLVINALWFVPAFGTGIPVVKLSQAVGPFTKPLTKLVSFFFLSRMNMIVCRGEESAKELQGLGVNVPMTTLPDCAFCLAAGSAEDAKALMDKGGVPDGVPYVVFGPSHVVAKRVVSHTGSDSAYIESLAAAAEWLLQNSPCHIVFLAHEVKGGRQNDLPVCEAVLARLAEHSARVHLLPFEVNPKITKKVCEGAEVAVGSRFHFLVGSISSGVPSLATAWNHKYFEMMRMVQQEDMVIQFSDITPNRIVQSVERLWSERQQRKGTIQSLLPKVIDQARENAVIVYKLLQSLKHQPK